MNKLIHSICLTSALLSHTCLVAALPDKEFACKVQTETLSIGAVLVQAWDLASANKIALASPAETMAGNTEAVQLVLECLPFPGGLFSDSAFQAFLENMPR
ncbi:MAG: hypothetical protein ACI9JM_001898 [Halioglobus sp.]|jgi:hypothetical protein